jgi:hypothetical protein
MTNDTSAASTSRPWPAGGSPAPARRDTPAGSGRPGSWLPTWGLIATKHLELRKRRVLMVVAAVLTVGLPVLVLGLRLLFHAVDPHNNGPAGSPAVFEALCNPLAEFGFIIAATLGATAGTSDLTDGVFRHLVATGRSRLALYLARIPAGLAILLPLVAVAFAMVCLVTSYEGVPQPTVISLNGVSVPTRLDQAQLENWITTHPRQAGEAFANGPGPGHAGNGPVPVPAATEPALHRDIATVYAGYASDEAGQLNPPVNEMAKIGLWIELYVGVGFIVGLGLGSLIGQRTVPIIVLIALEIIVTPILAAHVIPYFLDGQRLVVGIPLDQLRPAGLAVGQGGPGGAPGPGRVLFGGRGALAIPPMPTWAMITVIAGWIVGWSGIGAWRMVTRDA